MLLSWAITLGLLAGALPWQGKSLFDGHTLPHALSDGNRVKSELGDRIHDGSFYAIESELCAEYQNDRWARPLRTPISVLFKPVSPTAVFGPVITVDVNSINAVLLRRTSSDFGKKRFVAVSPSRADTNPSRAIVSVIVGVGVFAARNHIGPGTILWCFSPIPPFTVTQIELTSVLTPSLNTVTTARDRPPSTEHRACNELFVPTNTATKPRATRLTFSEFCEAKRRPTSKLPVGHVDVLFHALIVSANVARNQLGV